MKGTISGNIGFTVRGKWSCQMKERRFLQPSPAVDLDHEEAATRAQHPNTRRDHVPELASA